MGKVKDLETYVRSSSATGGTPHQGVRVEYEDPNDLDKAKKSFCDLDVSMGVGVWNRTHSRPVYCY